MSEEKNGWAEYGKLVLNELQRLNDNYSELKKDIDEKFLGLSKQISDVQKMEVTVSEIKIWKDKMDEVISPTQLSEIIKDVQDQKIKWAKSIGILAAIEVAIGLIVFFKEHIF